MRSSESPRKSEDLAPPRWMSRSEKFDFRRLIDARKAVSKPVLPTEFDLLCDYVSARSRIALLRKMAKAAVAKCHDSFDPYGQHPFGHEPAQRHAMALLRQCESATASCRRLARDLHLNEQPTREATDG
jgi:hypothetical protein